MYNIQIRCILYIATNCNIVMSVAVCIYTHTHTHTAALYYWHNTTGMAHLKINLFWGGVWNVPNSDQSVTQIGSDGKFGYHGSMLWSEVISAPDRVECFVSHPVLVTPADMACGSHWIESWMISSVCLVAFAVQEVVTCACSRNSNCK